MSDQLAAAAAVDERAKTFIAPQDAVAWFLRDMADVSGYMGRDNGVRSPLAAYSLYRPVLTAPDPWYFAGVVALEACKICDLFPSEQSKEVMREVFATMDQAIGRTDEDASSLAFLIMGRLGMGSILLHRKVPDNLLAKVMLILLGSAAAALGRQIKAGFALDGLTAGDRHQAEACGQDNSDGKSGFILFVSNGIGGHIGLLET